MEAAKPAAAMKQDAKKMEAAPAKKMEAAKPAAPAKAEAPKMKKDGTPDMRMKENKAGYTCKTCCWTNKKRWYPRYAF